MVAAASPAPVKILGRYALHEKIAAGGMASVHFGRLLGPVGFSRTVAIKRLHERLAQDPEFAAMFLDEARLTARIRHPNVIQTIDVVALEGELFVVMEYVQGESLARLFASAREAKTPMPARMVTTILANALRGLHAAHEATDDHGVALGLVHRDVSPQNILVGVDGVARVLDFGVAKAAGRSTATRDGQLKGKLAYMAPEQLRRNDITRAADIFAAGIVLWEGLAGRRLFKADSEAEVVTLLLTEPIEPPSKFNPEISPGLDAIALKALEREPGDRFETARDMARALEQLSSLMPASEIGEWVETVAAQALAERATCLAQMESSSSRLQVELPSSSSPMKTQGPEERSAPGEHATGGDLEVSQPFLPQTPTKGAIAFAVACALMLTVGIIGIVASRGSSTANKGGGSQESVRTAPPASVAIPTPSATSDASANPVNETPVATATAAASTAPATVPDRPVATTALTTTARPVARPAANAGCDPPYVVDASGTRRYKRECLK